MESMVELERNQVSLRTSLEESHNTLLTRVREMESRVELERNQVGAFTIMKTCLCNIRRFLQL